MIQKRLGEPNSNLNRNDEGNTYRKMFNDGQFDQMKTCAQLMRQITCRKLCSKKQGNEMRIGGNRTSNMLHVDDKLVKNL